MKYLKHFANAQEAATILATWPFNTISSIEGQSGIRYSEGVPVGPVVPTDRIVLKFMVTAEDWNKGARKYKKCLIGLTDDEGGDIPYDGSCFAYMIKDNERIDRNFWSQFIYFDTIGEHTVELVFNEKFDGNLPNTCLFGSEIYEVVIPSCVTSIGNHAFYNCSGLTSVTIPDAVTSIGKSAFAGCSGLTSVTIPDGVRSIGDYAFSGCSGLTSVTIPDAVTSIGEGAFSDCSGLTSVTIPDGVTTIGKSAFAFCSGLTSVTIPDGVTSIGSEAFSYCSGLTSVTIGSGVTSIGSMAFYNCSGLTSVTIPDAVTSIGDNAFDYCSGLTSITCLRKTPPTSKKNSFTNTNNCPIYVPASSVNTYKGASVWSTYASRIQAIQ